MKKLTFYSLVFIGLSCWLSPLYAADQKISITPIFSLLLNQKSTTSECGDGVVDAVSREECDDGNIVDGDGCSSACKIETGTCTSGAQTVNYGGHEWQRCDDGQWYNWDEAYAYCDNLSLGGNSDWRIPTRDELKSLVVCTNGTPTPLADPPGYPSSCGDRNSAPFTIPTIDPLFFRNIGQFWSSSVSDYEGAWLVSFYTGYSSWDYRTTYHFVRCVR